MFHVNVERNSEGHSSRPTFFQKLKEFVCVLVRGRHHLKFPDEGANHTVCLHHMGAHSINPSCHEQRSNQRLIEYCNNRQCYECQPVRRDMEEEVYHAELANASRDTKILNGVAGVTIAVAIVFLFLGITLGEVVKSDGASEIDRGVRVPVWERGGQDYITNLTNGFVLETGDYEVLETENEWNSTHVFVEYELPLEEGGAAPNGLISLAYWLPKVPEGTKVPVIAEFGPYFQEPSVQTQQLKYPVVGLVR